MRGIFTDLSQQVGTERMFEMLDRPWLSDHRRLMLAVSKFWAQLENVSAPDAIDFIPMPEYQCEMAPPLRVRLASMYDQFIAASRTPPSSQPLNLEGLMSALFAIRAARQEELKTLTEHRNNFFTVFFPADDRINLFRAVREPSMDGRNLSWWAYKRGIDFSRIRNIHWEDGHMVMDIMLSENADESQIRDAGDALILQGNGPAPGVLRFSERLDPTSFACDPGVQVLIDQANSDAASE